MHTSNSTPVRRVGSVALLAAMLFGLLGLVGPAHAAAPITTHTPAAAVAEHTATAAPTITARPAGNWTWYGYRLNRAETNQIANLSLWSAASGAQGSGLIPYSRAIMAVYSINWVLTARNARSMGRCLAISYAGVGLIVGCP